MVSWIISSARLQKLCLVTHTHSTPQYALKRPSLSIPKSSYLLVRLKFPTFTKAASWDSISESYNNRTSKLVTISKPNGKGAVFPYLLHLGMGVKYTECFEMRQSSHSMILHRKQTMNQSSSKHCVFTRASRVKQHIFSSSANEWHAFTRLDRFASLKSILFHGCVVR